MALPSLNLNTLLDISDPSVSEAIPGDFKGMHEWFYNALLITANSLPIQSLWIAFFDRIPFVDAIDNYEGTESNYFDSFSNLSAPTDKVGAIFAQAINIPGDGIKTRRVGPDQSGMVKGVIADGRNDMENVQMSFLETNESFTDFVLRPWSIMIGHHGLKYSIYKTNLTVFHLGKMGSGKPLKIRKTIKFKNVCPVSIDQQQYDYGADKILQRQVEFAYESYTMQSGKLAEAGGGLLEAFGLKRPLDRITNLPNELTERVTETVQDLVKGTAKRIVTNVAGQAGEAVDKFISRGEASLRDAANRGVSSITNKTGEVINSISRFNASDDTSERENSVGGGPNATSSATTSFNSPETDDTPYGGLTIAQDNISEKNIPLENKIERVKQFLIPLSRRDPLDTRIEVEVKDTTLIKEDDTPVFNPSKDFSNGLVKTLSNGGVNAKETVKDIAFDSPTFFPGDNKADATFTQMPGPLADSPSYPSQLKDSVVVNSNDALSKNVNSNSINIQNVNINATDGVNSKTVKTQEVDIKKSNLSHLGARESVVPIRDTPSLKDKTIRHVANQNDVVDGKRIESQPTSINKDDNVRRDNINVQNAVINASDTITRNSVIEEAENKDKDSIKREVATIIDNIKNAEPRIKKQTKISNVDTVKNDGIKHQQVDIKGVRLDSTRIPVQIVDIRGDDTREIDK